MLAGPVRLGRAWGLGWITPVLGALVVVARRSELGTDRGPSLLLDVPVEDADVALGWPLGLLVAIAAVWPGCPAGSPSHHCHQYGFSRLCSGIVGVCATRDDVVQT
jgi:hypothetical protein